jgi:uncharacterized alkaline shock family protein YloU
MPERPIAGRAIVTRRALVDIVRSAVLGSYGVTGFADPSLTRRILRWVGLERPGIRLSTDDGLSIDLYITVAFGVPVAEVARQVDSAVRYSLRHAAGVEVTALAIHVDGLRCEPAALERAEAIERAESTDQAIDTRSPDRVDSKSAAEGAPARRRTRSK